MPANVLTLAPSAPGRTPAGPRTQAADWALLGNLDLAGKTTTDQRMSLSIIRDLIVLDAGNSGIECAQHRHTEGACPATIWYRATTCCGMK